MFLAGVVMGILVTLLALTVIVVALEDREKGNGW